MPGEGEREERLEVVFRDRFFVSTWEGMPGESPRPALWSSDCRFLDDNDEGGGCLEEDEGTGGFESISLPANADTSRARETMSTETTSDGGLLPPSVVKMT